MLMVDIKKKLTDFTLNARFTLENNILVLFGPSGAGKTTILRCLAGLIRPDEGSISFRGKQFFSSGAGICLPPQQRRIGYMFQELALFPHMNVEKNIWYGARGPQKNSELYEKLLRLLKIEHLSTRTIRQLSGGEKQRVALARVLMSAPEILLLDEPLSALDSHTRTELWVELKNVQKLWNIPCILVTHDYEEARVLGDQFYFIERGSQVSCPFTYRQTLTTVYWDGVS